MLSVQAIMLPSWSQLRQNALTSVCAQLPPEALLAAADTQARTVLPQTRVACDLVRMAISKEQIGSLFLSQV